jgi:hypothetical protein
VGEHEKVDGVAECSGAVAATWTAVSEGRPHKGNPTSEHLEAGS